MPLIQWSEGRHDSPIRELDDEKRRLIELVNDMEGVDDSQLRMQFIRLLAHIERFFERESRLMEDTGFPGIDEHRHEHRQMLQEVRYLLERVESGLYSLGHTYIRARLPEWFNNHCDTLDSELGSYLQENRSAA